MIAAGLALVALGVLLFVPGLVQNRRRRKARADMLIKSLLADRARLTDQRDRYCRLYHEAVKRNAALLEHIGDEREAAAVQALVESPAYFEAVAARKASRIAYEWFDLASEEGTS